MKSTVYSKSKFLSFVIVNFLMLLVVACGPGGWGNPYKGTAPTITSTDNVTFAEGVAATFTVTATGNPTPTFALTGTLPSGVTFDNSTGVLSGTPVAGTYGIYSLTITASNGVLPDATQNFTLNVPYEENFESLSSLDSEGWFIPAGVTGTIQVVSDPTGSGRGNVLKLLDSISSTSDVGAVIYSPVIDQLTTVNLTTLQEKTTIYLDFYIVGIPELGNHSRWFVIGKTHAEAFALNEGDYGGNPPFISAYAEGATNTWITCAYNKWYRLKIIINNTPGTYDVELSDPDTLSVIGTITGKELFTGNYDSYHGVDSNGRLMFGSWFSYSGAPDSSYDHIYIDNIEVTQ
jgi:hypothetical protein